MLRKYIKVSGRAHLGVAYVVRLVDVVRAHILKFRDLPRKAVLRKSKEDVVPRNELLHARDLRCSVHTEGKSGRCFSVPRKQRITQDDCRGAGVIASLDFLG